MPLCVPLTLLLLLLLVGVRLDAVDSLAGAGRSAAAGSSATLTPDDKTGAQRHSALRSRAGKDAHCSGHGARVSPTSDFCNCDAGFIGAHCEFDQEARKYVGSSKCVHGVLQGDSTCRCSAGWAGDACADRRCDHGHLACPEGKHYCSQLQCVCHPGWAGPACAERANQRCSPRARSELGPCLHGGVFNEATCACDCPPGSHWTGRNCGTCSASGAHAVCPQPLALFNKSTCACECHEDQLLQLPCAHGGLFNEDTCSCDCPKPWGGPGCAECRETQRHCYNGGQWNDFDCICDCHAPWSPADRCLTCPLLDCKNGGVFLQDECRCRCEGKWTGDECDECPSLQELIVTGMDCERRGFSEDTCSCNEECPPRECLHGGVQNTTSCTCDCNPQAQRSISGAVGARGPLQPAGTPGSVGAVAREGASFVQLGAEHSAGQATAIAIRHLRVAAEGAAHIFSSQTFWAGERCELCVEPPPPGCGGARAFDAARCACSDSCGPFNCSGYGTKNEETCTCDCPLTRNGAFCQFEATGRSPESAAASCRIIRLLDRRAMSGWYWLSYGRTPPFQAYCDLADDGGGWTQIAKIGPSLSQTKLTVATYQDGLQSTQRAEYVLPCSMLSGLGTAFRRTADEGSTSATLMPLSSFVLRVRMGKVQDYFKPMHAASLCEMLTSNTKHEWAPKYFGQKFSSAASASLEVEEEAETTETPPEEGEEGEPLARGTWAVPAYVNDSRLEGVLGGCLRGWPSKKSAYPEDARDYVSFWGGAETGGCCNYFSGIYPAGPGNQRPDVGKWGLEFSMQIIETVRVLLCKRARPRKRVCWCCLYLCKS
eukprot:INCI453.3.p1 GENE.INCI453.3~~INCI453.3.p1  ORF type:complete len:827 (+),score=55.05 INCI453.3:420-2900(+)